MKIERIVLMLKKMSLRAKRSNLFMSRLLRRFAPRNDAVAMVYLCICFNLSLMLLSANFAFSYEPLTDFYDGNMAYRQGDYLKAINAYENVLKSNYANGALYFNLANSYFKADNLGKAILNYERALSYIPRDSDLKANYRYALNQARFTRQSNKNIFDYIVDRYRGYFTKNELDAISLVLFCIAILIFTLHLYFYRRNRGFNFGILLVIILFVFNFYAQKTKIANMQSNVIMLKSVEANFEPSEKATVHYKLFEGEKAQVIDEELAWYKVAREDGKIGWIPKNSTEKIF